MARINNVETIKKILKSHGYSTSELVDYQIIELYDKVIKKEQLYDQDFFPENKPKITENKPQLSPEPEEIDLETIKLILESENYLTAFMTTEEIEEEYRKYNKKQSKTSQQNFSKPVQTIQQPTISSSKNGALSDDEFNALLNSGCFGLPSDNHVAANPHGRITVFDVKTNKEYAITNWELNKGNGLCGANWVPLCIRLGCIEYTGDLANFGIDRNSDNDNLGLRAKICNLYEKCKDRLVETKFKESINEQHKSSSDMKNWVSLDYFGEKYLFGNEFRTNPGQYMSTEEVYVLAYLLGIKVKILAWDPNIEKGTVLYDQQIGNNKEPIHLYLWGGHYYVMKCC